MVDPLPTRRQIIAAAPAALAVAAAGSASAAEPAFQSPMAATVPLALPRTELVFEALVTTGPAMSMGQGPHGERRIIPITGGTFTGPRMRGKVLPGGADRQLIRTNGARELRALYELQTDDGALITVDNRVLIHQQAGGRYAFSNVFLTAPEETYGWINLSTYVGTLDSVSPTINTGPLIRVYRLL